MSREEDRCLVAESLLFRIMSNPSVWLELEGIDSGLCEDLERWVRFALHCAQGGTQTWTDFE